MNVGLFAAAAAAFGCVVWIVHRVLGADEDAGPGGPGRRRGRSEPPPLPDAPCPTVSARRNDLARSA